MKFYTYIGVSCRSFTNGETYGELSRGNNGNLMSNVSEWVANQDSESPSFLLLEGTESNKARVFDSGATRNSELGKLDYDGFLSPDVLISYAEYMHKQRTMEDGTFRDSDNWQKGIPKTEYMKSMWRHFMDVWKTRRDGYDSDKKVPSKESKIEQLNALLFNVMGLLHEELKNNK